MTDYSFEIFPPKEEAELDKTYGVLDRLDSLKPSLISVTYGAGGSSSKKTLELVKYIKKSLRADALAHMTCVGYKKETLKEMLTELENIGCKRILALRGDRPKWMSDEEFEGMEFSHASDMIAYIKEHSSLEIAAACYPEKHPAAASAEEDLTHLKEKVEAGATLLITQMFFDNDIFYRFLEQLEKRDIHAKVDAGIMPITSSKQLGTSVTLSGSSIPKALSDLIARYGEDPEDMRKAGIDFAARQIQDLIDHGADGVHIYSMNRARSMEDLIHEIFPGN